MFDVKDTQDIWGISFLIIFKFIFVCIGPLLFRRLLSSCGVRASDWVASLVVESTGSRVHGLQ